MIALLTALLQGAIGFGIVRHLELRRGGMVLSLSFLAGLPASSLLVIAVDRFPIALSSGSVLAAFAAAAIVANLGRRDRSRIGLLSLDPRRISWRAHALVFCVVIVLFCAVSLWQCLYLPVIPRDATVGMDLVAKYAAEEGRIRSSVFTGAALEGRLSNQPYYAPFVMLMQLTYRLAGVPFGKLWLSILFLSFLLFLHARLRERLHPIPAGLLLLCFVTVPLMFSYSYLVATDLANAVFFGLGAIFLHDHLRGGRDRPLLMSGLFMGFACWSRSETILFVLPGALAVLWHARRSGAAAKAARAAAYLALPLFLFGLWHLVYCRFVLEGAPGTAVFSPAAAGRSLGGTAAEVAGLLGAHSLYGTAFLFLGAVVLLNLAWLRDREGAWLLAWVPLLLVGFIALVQVVPAASVENTVKRGLFKLFPILVVYAGESRLYRSISDRLAAWESGDEREATAPPESLP